MATRRITEQEQEIADATGGRYRTDLNPDGVAMNYRPPRGGSTYVSEELNTAGAGRGRSRPAVESKKRGGTVSSASKRADGIATKGKTKGRMI